ncbi:cation diffusion facilitator family transporter [Raineyella fluvialis]|uniref:Cation diffusion facilitator family transporter n=1 Tax=Raineyella fluvialis TaxID=2662261 RepID=A0A5Q2F915_9ACTN|nr:cation diffusion facilitator family transporter [Raineyella fluvialis]QGF22941.1 cation diffusion facilitator family transporter [Raineyella fluvialis]
MGHDHSHGSHSHGTAPERRLVVALGITATVLVAEVAGAALTRSLALLTDAAHMLTDTAGLALAVMATRLATRPADERRTWGFRRAEVISAQWQAAILLAVGVYALIDGVQRLLEPPHVPSGALLVFGVIGLAGNLASLAVLLAHRDVNLNLRAAFLEVANDALGSVAVIVSAILIGALGWLRADAVAAMVIAVLIIPRTLALLRYSTVVLLEWSPKGLDLAEVRRHLLEIDHVLEVHDLHASVIATGLPVLSAHVVVEEECFRTGHAPLLLDALQSCVAGHFPVSVEHSTFQLEPPGHRDHEDMPGV